MTAYSTTKKLIAAISAAVLSVWTLTGCVTQGGDSVNGNGAAGATSNTSKSYDFYAVADDAITGRIGSEVMFLDTVVATNELRDGGVVTVDLTLEPNTTSSDVQINYQEILLVTSTGRIAHFDVATGRNSYSASIPLTGGEDYKVVWYAAGNSEEIALFTEKADSAAATMIDFYEVPAGLTAGTIGFDKQVDNRDVKVTSGIRVDLNLIVVDITAEPTTGADMVPLVVEDLYLVTSTGKIARFVDDNGVYTSQVILENEEDYKVVYYSQGAGSQLELVLFSEDASN